MLPVSNLRYNLWVSTFGSAVLTRASPGVTFSSWIHAAPGVSLWGAWRPACNPWSGRTGWRSSSASATASANASAPAPWLRPAGHPASSAPRLGPLGACLPLQSSPESCLVPSWSPPQRTPRPPGWSPQQPSPTGQPPVGLSQGDGPPAEHPPQTPEGCRWCLIGSFCVTLGGEDTEDKMRRCCLTCHTCTLTDFNNLKSVQVFRIPPISRIQQTNMRVSLLKIYGIYLIWILLIIITLITIIHH